VSVNIEKTDIETAKEKASGMKYACLQGISEFRLGKAQDIIGFNENECMEARFFSPECEVRLFRENDKLCSVILSDGEGDHIDQYYEIGDRFDTEGRYAVVRKYVDEDEDGQAFITAVRLVDIKEA